MLYDENNEKSPLARKGGDTLMAKYQHFDPRHMAELAHHYLTSMVDEKNGYLPYWLILPNQKPAEAAHCRVDDAELVGSWYEGLDSAMQVLDTDITIPIPGRIPCTLPSMKWAISCPP